MTRTEIDGEVAIDSVGPDDWERWRALRLRALADAPTAFASSLAKERAFAEQDWRARLAAGPRLIAHHDGADVAIAGAHFGDGPALPQVHGMWVHPDWRGHRLGARLLDAIADWMRTHGHRHLRLWVMPDNDAARILYGRGGFVPEPDPPKPAPGSCELAMVLDLERSR